MKRPPRPASDAPPDYAKAVYEARLLLTFKKVASIEKNADTRAHKVAALAKLRFVQSLLDVAERMRANGKSLQDAKDALRAHLTKAASLQVPDAYLKLAIQNNVQSSYNAGKVEQFLSPDTRVLRPFWMFDAVLDFRTSTICRTCHGVIRPAGDAWFMMRIPPLHHWCRSTIRSLTRAVSRAQGGVDSRPPRIKPDDGFGRMGGADWKPSLANVAPALVKVYRTRS